LEGFSYYVMVIKDRNFYLPRDLTTEKIDAQLADFAKVYSFGLGWEFPHPNPYGFRGAARDVQKAMIALFGDSFTQGHPDIEKSWPHLLAQALGKPVLNFGVNGYGTDQAYLRFKTRYIGNIHTPYVCLVIMSENIARIVNYYRGFYCRKTHVEATKPMYYRSPDGSIRLLENPIKNIKDFRRLGDLDFLRQIGKYDFWYQYYENYGLNQKIHFPYSYFLMKSFPFYIKKYYEKRILNLADHNVLYQDPFALSIMEHIIAQFVTEAKAADSFPIVLFLPYWKDMIDYQQDGRTVYQAFFLHIKKQYHACYDGLSYFAPHLNGRRKVGDFFKSYLDGHYNDLGEQVVSAGFARDLLAIETSRSVYPRP